MAEARDIGDGIHVVPVPVGDLPVGDTQVYVMESPRGVVLVDVGWNDDRSWAALQNGLATAGLSVTDVEGVVVTHFHPDHVGLTGRIQEASGCWVAMNEADFAHLEVMLSDVDRRPREAELLRRAGAPEDAIDEVLTTAVPAVGRPDVLPDRKLGADETIPLSGRSLRTVLTPGHTPGHACFLLEEHGVLFTGDHVLATTTPHVGEFDFPLPQRDALGEYFDSLRAVADLPVRRALPAHRQQIDDLPHRAGELIAHHDRRLDDLYDAFGDEELTLWEATARMRWYRPWTETPVHGKRMALAEGSAHVRQLIERGRVRRVPGTEPARFARIAVNE
ncbi:beta lactamase [Rhodococcus gordoniae]|uniref:Beta lactamase n=1 Tax=Rhodococcus gordoniae TaxID=223392 RepID=A0A379LTM5_9NOCA|nr:MBL fold metallo-hydrolase [Rhodococcus gordoniae]UTT49991.1 MBL fold metallo-hydrolase [Rhodococcus gordoniae]SUE13387.1 beta lactamase [Rhodococcus gordoniae]